MFTGLIETTGELVARVAAGGGQRLHIACGLPRDEIALGDSIAVDGVCLTVTAITGRGFTADVSPESLERTTLGEKPPGSPVNLERALRLGDRLGGHIVTGHIDATAMLETRRQRETFLELTFAVPSVVGQALIEKGSVAVDGVSLTVNHCSAAACTVTVIPHTLARTTLPARRPGDRVNIETDIIGKYVETFVRPYGRSRGGVTRELLEKYDFS